MSKTLLPPKIQREIRATFGRERISALDEQHAPEVDDHRALNHPIHALIRARSLDFGDLFGGLKREEFQGMSDVLGLARSASEKEAFVIPVVAAAPMTQTERSRPPHPADHRDVS